MGSGLLQLVAYGAQDVYLTGNPQITFFKTVYRRHTNFAIEAIEQTFQGTADFGKKVTCTISRNGDLINRIYLQVQLPALSVSSVYADNAVRPDAVAWTNSVGHALIRYVTIEVGGQKIDTHYGEWLEIWNSLTQVSEKENGYNHMVGTYNAPGSFPTNATSSRIYYIPLMFWFCRNPGLSLPLIALQYHEVKINLEFRNAIELVIGVDAGGARDFAANTQSIRDNAGLSIVNAALWVDYVYLDTEERRRFAQMSHEYLIDQLQTGGPESIQIDQISQKNRLNYNHPVKELIWTLQWAANFTYGTAYNDWFNFSSSIPGTPELNNAVDLMSSALILLNGHERFSARPQTYFRLVQPYQHHTRIPENFIYLYSFGLRPEEHQPSGTINMSRIDNAYLKYDMTNISILPDDVSWSGQQGQIQIYATNYNVFRVMSGMGGLAYSN
jgi:Major capsid protein N-terminus/Large eukaryotic DNA virus major capsid protein